MTFGCQGSTRSNGGGQNPRFMYIMSGPLNVAHWESWRISLSAILFQKERRLPRKDEGDKEEEESSDLVQWSPKCNEPLASHGLTILMCFPPHQASVFIPLFHETPALQTTSPPLATGWRHILWIPCFLRKNSKRRDLWDRQDEHSMGSSAGAIPGS